MSIATTLDYQTFLATKQLIVPPCGVEIAPDQLHSALFPFQRDLTRWALRKGRSAIFAYPGLGKTPMQLAWAQHAGERVLILAPLAVAQQTVREGRKFDIPVTYARRQDQASGQITITNYELLDHFDPAAFDAVVLDECFAKGTQVRTGSGWKHIEDVRIGELILNAVGWDIVSDVHRREVSYAIRITVNGRSVISSPNHPYFTQRGWVAAQDILPNDYLMETASAVRMVHDNLYPEVSFGKDAAVLRQILLSEMADESARALSESPHSGSSCETRSEAASVAGVGESESNSRNRTSTPTQSTIHRSVSPRENFPYVARDAPQTFRAWGQWPRPDHSSTTNDRYSWERLASRVLFVTGSTDSRLSNALQTRLSAARAQNCYRGGWQLAPQPQGTGREERRHAGFTRVDRLEVLEPGHPDLERLRDADGQLYFYDLGGTRHPSFAVALGTSDTGSLVHNSGILKSYSGATRTALIEAFRNTPMRLCCTATPAPNDIAELANHAEFLGLLTRAEMLATFFVHDEEGWRLKGHAREPFYRWLASWGMSLRAPSDLGYSDEGYNLPPLDIQPVIVKTDYAPPGQLFATALKGIGDRALVRRDTMQERVAAAFELIASEPDEKWVVWCGLNAEQDAIAEALGDNCVSIDGRSSLDEKVDLEQRWRTDDVPVLVSKVAVFGFGMNWQACARMAFVGLSDSYEQYFQAIRRCYRFGQQREMKVWIVLTDLEESIYANVLRKEAEAERTGAELVKHIARFEQAEIAAIGQRVAYTPTRQMEVPSWLRS